MEPVVELPRSDPYPGLPNPVLREDVVKIDEVGGGGGGANGVL